MAGTRILRAAAPWLAGALLLFALVLAGLMRTGPGHEAVTWLVSKATGGEVVIAGLDGALPNHLRARRILLRDADGVWLQADNVSLEWSALPALANHIVIHKVSATKISISRRPRNAQKSSGTTSRIDIDLLSLPHIALGASLAGHRALLAARGSLHYASRYDLGADIVVTRPGSSDRYVARGTIADDVAEGSLAITEGTDGLLGQLIGLPGLRPVNLRATASGSRATNAISLTLSAGVLSARGQGTLSLANRRADIVFAARSPAMQLDPTLGWASLAVQGHFAGGFDAPGVTADLRLAGLVAGGVYAADVRAEVRGHGGTLRADTRIDGLRLPGNAPGLLAGAPIMAVATADLSAAARPVQFSLTHPVLALAGTATTRGELTIDARLTIPSLAPFGALTRAPLAGSAALTLNASQNGTHTVIGWSGTFAAQGDSLAARLLGHATLTGKAIWAGADIPRSQLAVDGTGVALRVSGALQSGRLDYHASLEMKDLSRLTKALTGHANLSAHITGPVAKAAVEASGAAELASKGFARQHLDIALQAVGLPEPASATFRANGRFDNAKLALDAVLAGQGTTRTARISADWKSLALRASIVLPAKRAPTGGGTLDVKSLDDLSPFTGLPAKGNLHLAAQMIARDGKSGLALQGRAADLTMAGSSLRTLTLDGTVIDPFAHSALALTFDASGLAAEGWSGDGRGSVRGALKGITLILDARLVDPQGNPAHVATQAVLDANHQTLNLQQLKADWQGETVSLAAPALVNFSSGVSIDDLRLEAGGGTITLSGQVTPRLALKAGAERIRAESISHFLPQISANGTLSGTADHRLRYGRG
jgi:translocation and assembly module TamB